MSQPQQNIYTIRKHCRGGGAEDCKSQRTSMSSASVFYVGQKECIQEITTIQFSKRDLHNDSLSWYANMDIESSQVPIPHMKNYRQLMILKEWGKSFL